MHRGIRIVPDRITRNWTLLNGRKTNSCCERTRRYSTVESEDRKYQNKLEFPAAYKPGIVEDGTSCDKYFLPPLKDGKRPFTLILPPPNITGTLHLGHALTVTVQDALVRWNRMRGIHTEWIPGTDHAGIATQVVVEKLLWKEKRQTRHDLGRQAFEKEIWKWKEEKADTIVARIKWPSGQQLRRLGAMLDWNREMFTMDPLQSRAVSEAFVKLYEDGLIYRSDYLVNWSCVLQSAISDVEVEKLEITGPTRIAVPGYEKPVEFGVLTSFAYKLHDSAGDEEIVVSTTRPETAPGDVAVAVNPKDSRYSSLVGRSVWHPFRKQAIPIIADEFVDPEYGTGAVKVTPAHDPIDFEVSKRHNLPILQVIDEKGQMTGEFFGDSFPILQGLGRFDARRKITQEFARLGLLRGTKDHATILPICGRSKDVLEYLIKPQWFVKCDEMAKKALNDVQEKRLVIEPSRFEKNWSEWLENIRDWCVSRQLWWGHRIPIFLCEKKDSGDKTWIAATNLHSATEKAKHKFGLTSENDLVITQDDDVLDTWFSSALLPFTAFGWPEKLDHQKYPLDIMETGHDILFFWVARMVMLGNYLTGRLPFEKVLLHGVICDRQGRKMSKSVGNVISPENVIFGSTLDELNDATRKNHAAGLLSDQELSKALVGQKKMFPSGIPACGADALRFTLCSHNIKNHYINFDVDECNTNRLFCNKIWQATKFTNSWADRISSERCDMVVSDCLSGKTALSKIDRWILSRLFEMVRQVDASLSDGEFHASTDALKNFLYYEFCDVYLECTKRGLRSLDDARLALGHYSTLASCLDVGLRALAPFMPHLAQYLHQRLSSTRPRRCTLQFPSPQELLHWKNDDLENQIQTALEVVVGIRRLKKIFGISRREDSDIILVSSSLPNQDEELCHILQDLAGVGTLAFSSEKPSGSATRGIVHDSIMGHTVVYLSAPSDLLSKSLVVDTEKVNKKRAKLIKELERIRRMTSEDGYKTNADAKVQDGHSKKITSLEEELARIDYVQNYNSLRL